MIGCTLPDIRRYSRGYFTKSYFIMCALTRRPYTLVERDPESGKLQLKSYGRDDRAVGMRQMRKVRKMAQASTQPLELYILGGGVSGLTTAYELLKERRGMRQRYNVTILEASNRLGGRSLTLRNGDTFTETIQSGKRKGQQVTQRCTFETERGAPYPAYLNAGPGRIPSVHTHVLKLCKELKVDMEVYIMESRSNRNYPWSQDAPVQREAWINRRIANDTRGHIAKDLYDRLVQAGNADPRYLSLLRNFGALVAKDAQQNSPDGQVVYAGSTRSGLLENEGLNAGVPMPPLPMEDLLASDFWDSTKFYQPEDLHWQPSSFQPVGGMDMIEKALTKAITRLGGRIILNAAVTKIWLNDHMKPSIQYTLDGKVHAQATDWCFCNIPIPLLQGKLEQPRSFGLDFGKSIEHLWRTPGFLQPTCKVGWQARRDLWQGLDGMSKTPTVAPIFGGISYTTHPITQMWYPSDRIHDQLGVLTGAYNYSPNADAWGEMEPQERLAIARAGAAQLHGEAFAKGLDKGLSIAWQNIPTQGGGWVEWAVVEPTPDGMTSAEMMEAVRNGGHNLQIIGDQVSFLPGWKEGAIAVAEEATLHALVSLGILGQKGDFVRQPVMTVPNTMASLRGRMY